MDDALAVRRLRPWEERVGLDASLTNVAKGKRDVGRRASERASQLPLPVGAEAVFYASGHERPLNRSLPAVDSSKGVWATFRQSLAGDNLRGVGPRVFYERHDFHKVRAHLVDGFHRNLAREQCRAADAADVLLLERLELARRHAAHTAAVDARLQERVLARGFDGTRRPELGRPAQPPTTFVASLTVPEVLRVPMQRWPPHSKVIV